MVELGTRATGESMVGPQGAMKRDSRATGVQVVSHRQVAEDRAPRLYCGVVVSAALTATPASDRIPRYRQWCARVWGRAQRGTASQTNGHPEGPEGIDYLPIDLHDTDARLPGPRRAACQRRKYSL